jgi:hypothetical protein
VAEFVIVNGAKEHRITYVAFCVIMIDLVPTNGPTRDSLLVCWWIFMPRCDFDAGVQSLRLVAQDNWLAKRASSACGVCDT